MYAEEGGNEEKEGGERGSRRNRKRGDEIALPRDDYSNQEDSPSIAY